MFFSFFRMPDEYYEPVFGIEESEGGRKEDLFVLIEIFLMFLFFFIGFQTNSINQTLELR
jgi:hypothetical protein